VRVLVTGVAGFVGTALAMHLLEQGDSVSGVDNFCDQYDPRIKRHSANRLMRNGVDVQTLDIRDREGLLALVRAQHYDCVVHLAGLSNVRRSVDDPASYVDVNVGGTANVLEASRLGGIGHVVLASTSSVYGDSDQVPFTEMQSTDRPLAPYPASKKAAEVLLHGYHNAYGLDSTVVRLFNVYGPGGRPDMMPFRIAAALSLGRPIRLYGNGIVRRDWTYIDDVACGLRAIVHACRGYEILNLGLGRPLSMREFVAIAERITGQHAVIENAPLPRTEPSTTFADMTKTKSVLHYAPTTGVEQGFKALWAWYEGDYASLARSWAGTGDDGRTTADR
jgi:UDP-glucuronate 4-epimerase